MNYKKLLLGLLSLQLVLFAPIVASAQSAPSMPDAFSDVESSNPHYQAILYLKTKGVIQGYSDGSYKPEQTVNRVEALKMLLFSSGIEINPHPDLNSLQFTDINTKAWYMPILTEAVNRKIVQGYADGTFKPAQTVNLVENLKMLFLTNNIDTTNINVPENPFADGLKGTWYDQLLQEAKVMNLTTADENNNIYPGQGMTRGKLAEMMYRFMYTREHGLEAFPDHPWQIVQTKTFSLQLPENWWFKELQGIDSYIGEFTGENSGKNLKLTFDYGWYSGTLVNDDDPGYIITSETIDGREAKLVKPKDQDGLTGVYFDNIDGENKLTIQGQIPLADQELMFEVFRTIHFTEKTPAAIEIFNYQFEPGVLTIKAGTTVTWYNKDLAEHSIINNDTGSELSSGLLMQNDSYAKTFNEPGTYEYHCGIHPFMTGKIIVE